MKPKLSSEFNTANKNLEISNGQAQGSFVPSRNLPRVGQVSQTTPTMQAPFSVKWLANISKSRQFGSGTKGLENSTAITTVAGSGGEEVLDKCRKYGRIYEELDQAREYWVRESGRGVCGR